MRGGRVSMSSIDTKKAEPEKPKTAWDSILTSTPVILTVIATLLAGLSSSEMTRAQYHRALAAQHQSKAGDQWNFFQAKRIRGTNMETTIDLLHGDAEISSFDSASVLKSAEQLMTDLRRAGAELDHLLGLLGSAKEKLGTT